jgi:hypothetical protein
MNHDPISSSAASQPPNRDADDRESGQNADASGGQERDASTQSRSEASTYRKLGLGKKLQFMTHLMRSLDMIVFAEICTLYYME